MNRRTTLVPAALLLLVASGPAGTSHAGPTVPAPPPHVPLGSRYYSDVEELRKAGVPVEIRQGAVTREAFAVGIAGGLAEILKRSDPSLEKLFGRRGLDVSGLIRLVTEFEPELWARGVDTVAARQRFARLPVPRDHYAYQLLDRLRNAPIEIGYDNEPPPPPLTRRELARQTAAFISKSGAKPGGATLPPDRLNLLIQLVRTFESELRLAGIDASGAMARLAKEKETVPNRAPADPMEILRRAGIFRGYPGEIDQRAR